MQEQEFKILIEKYLSGKCSDAEQAIIESWYNQLGKDELPLLSKEIKQLQSIQIAADLSLHQLPQEKQYTRYKIAASILLCIIIGWWAYPRNKENPVYNAEKKIHILPGGNRATLILGNGKVISLDSVANGQVIAQSGISITKTRDGSLRFTVSKNHAVGSDEFNTIKTPIGGEYQINLPDDSRVWMNASSSLCFSTNFSEQERKVKLNGEAYFEIAKKKNQKGQSIPFLVETNNQTIEVLGTHFNVSAYTNEAYVKTTLLEGKVMVKALPGSKLLAPGQQSVLDKKDNTLNVTNVDIESVMGWKNGLFVFDDEPIEEIMKKIARWYNVEIVYQNNNKEYLFGGSISRYKDLEKVLEKLELTESVHFRIEGRRVFVMK